MKTKVFKRVTPWAIAIDIEFEMDELAGLPHWCQIALKGMLNGFEHPLEVIDATNAIAHQINRQLHTILDTPPTLEGDLKAQNVKEVGSGPVAETDIERLLNATDKVLARETSGALVPERDEENGGVVQRIEGLENKVARLETWVIQLMMRGGGAN